jgi:hypothetical protein
MNFESFMSEHTAEYVLVPNITRRVSNRFASVVPFYFWKRREGNSLSLSQGSGIRGRLAAIYARRPKIGDNHPDDIIMKINSDIFEMAIRARTFKIPVFVGIPLMKSILDMRIDSPCSLFRVRGDEKDNSDLHCYLSTIGNAIRFERETNAIQGPLNDSELNNQIESDSEVLSWDEWLEHIKALRTGSIEYRNLYFGGSTYKPFYLFIFD